MPEGHVVHGVARRIRRVLGAGPIAASSPQGRFEQGAAAVDGRRLRSADAVGKHLFLAFARDLVVHVHLGLYGGWSMGPLPEPAVRGQVRLRLVGNRGWADLRGPTACELLRADEADAVRARLGPDPLRPDAEPLRAWPRLSRSRTSVAALLMDQTVVSGVGNVFRAEVLFRAKMSPFRPGTGVGEEDFERLWADLVHLMDVGVRRGRIDTVLPEHEPDAMGRPPRQRRRGGEVYVYRRTGMSCFVCGTAIRSEMLAGRTLYWCPTCQAS